MKRILCKPCSENLKVAFTVTQLHGRTTKDTCEECGKRRFCAGYEIRKETKK